MTGTLNHIYGIDFSGARDAGTKIWIAVGAADHATLRIDACYRARDLPGSGTACEPCLAALKAYIARQHACAFGLDFPFGLPQPLLAHDSWEAFVRSFPGSYPDVAAFRQSCRETSRAVADGCELKRATDRESRTPFSPYNLRLYRQTYYGIRDVLYPLVVDRSACILPMQRARPGVPWVLEICPASTLKRSAIATDRYKRGTGDARARRQHILEQIEASGVLHIPSPGVRAEILDDTGGDALDSVIAAYATFRATRHPAFPALGDDPIYALEGYVYV